MTSGRLKDLLSRVRQSDATSDATRDKGMSDAVAFSGKNDSRCDTRATNFPAEDLNHINDIATRETVLSHVASPRACDTRQAHPRTPLSPAALAELPPENAACPWWRISIVGPRALNIELEMRSAWTVSDWGRFARCHYGPDATVVARACPEPEPVTEEGAAEDLREDLEERSAIQRETSDPGALWGRVSILEPGGRSVEVDTPSGWTLADWSAYADRYHGPGCVVTAVLPASQASGTGQPR